MRLAALPVGAAIMTRYPIFSYRRMMALRVVVLTVPGPPVRIIILRERALKISVLHAVLGLLFVDELIPVLSCFRCAEIQDHPHTIGDVLFGDVVVLQIDKCPPAFVIGVDVVFVQQFGIGCVEVCHSNLEIGADLLP